MAIAFYAELPTMSATQAETVLQELKLNGRSPKGQLCHAEGPTADGGTWVFDVWESEQAFTTFIERDLAPIMHRLGITPPRPTMLSARVILTPQEMKYV